MTDFELIDLSKIEICSLAELKESANTFADAIYEYLSWAKYKPEWIYFDDEKFSYDVNDAIYDFLAITPRDDVFGMPRDSALSSLHDVLILRHGTIYANIVYCYALYNHKSVKFLSKSMQAREYVQSEMNIDSKSGMHLKIMLSWSLVALREYDPSLIPQSNPHASRSHSSSIRI